MDCGPYKQVKGYHFDFLFGVRRMKTKKLICICIILILTLCQVIDSCLDPGFVPIASILHEVQLMSGAIFTKYKADRLFDVKVSLVNRSLSAYYLSYSR